MLQVSVCLYRARVAYIDYEGRSDGDSIKKIINQMKPRQLIIVHGPPESSRDLGQSCKAFSGKDMKVYTPKLQETVDATSETHIYQVINPAHVTTVIHLEPYDLTVEAESFS